MIFITGDITYGAFDDSGSTLKWICSLMDSFVIPWAPVFGNHDNESKSYREIKWVFGLKTGQYDYHSVGQMGGTLVTVDGDDNDVCHIASLAPSGPYPIKAPLLSGILADGSNV